MHLLDGVSGATLHVNMQGDISRRVQALRVWANATAIVFFAHHTRVFLEGAEVRWLSLTSHFPGSATGGIYRAAGWVYRGIPRASIRGLGSWAMIRD